MFVVWLAAAALAAFAAFDLLTAVLTQTGQLEAARAMVDMAVAVIPLCLARAIHGIVRDLAQDKTLDVLRTHTKLLASIANGTPTPAPGIGAPIDTPAWRMCPSCNTPYGTAETKCRECGALLAN